MKKIYILAFVLGAFSFSAHAQFPLNDIESYPIGPLHTEPFVSWDGIAGTADDMLVSDDESFSGSQSILIPEGGVVDGVLNLGNKVSGSWQVDWEMYIPSGKSAYINMQNILPAGTEFNFHMTWNELGTTEGDAVLYDATGANQGPGNVLGTGSYSPDTWFHFSMMVDLDNLTMSISLDGVDVVSNIPYPSASAIPGLGGIDWYSNEGTGESNRYYIDDVSYSNLLGINTFDADSFSVYPNPVKDILKISSKASVDNVIVYDILGKVVLQENPGIISPTVNTSNLVPGTYLLKVTIGNS
jgi:hypothetical protein